MADQDQQTVKPDRVAAIAMASSLITSVVFLLFVALFAYVYRGQLYVDFARSGTNVSYTPAQLAALSNVSTSTDHTVTTVVARADPAVASVVITKDVPVMEQYYEQITPFGQNSPFGSIEIPQMRQNGSHQQQVGGGTGFFVSSDGLLVTNRHVVDDTSATYSVVLNDGTSYDAKVLVRDPQLDIAVLKVEGAPPSGGFPYLTFGNSAALLPGQSVIAIGNALAEFHNSVSVGVVSGLARSVTAGSGMGQSETLNDVIQTDAAINPGNSGGPLLDLAGQVIGINVAVAGDAQNIAFAIPSNMVSSIVNSVEKYGEIRTPYLGVRYIQLDAQIAKNNDLPVNYGAWIRGDASGPAVIKGSPAAAAGLQENDIITDIAGTSLKNTSLSSVVRMQDIGASVPITYLRDGQSHTTNVTLGTAPKSNTSQG